MSEPTYVFSATIYGTRNEIMEVLRQQAKGEVPDREAVSSGKNFTVSMTRVTTPMPRAAELHDAR